MKGTSNNDAFSVRLAAGADRELISSLICRRSGLVLSARLAL
jgi:hypothetical protein